MKTEGSGRYLSFGSLLLQGLEMVLLVGRGMDPASLYVTHSLVGNIET